MCPTRLSCRRFAYTLTFVLLLGIVIGAVVASAGHNIAGDTAARVAFVLIFGGLGWSIYSALAA